MTLIIKKGMFVHLPKTGGSFLRKVLTTFHQDAQDYKAKGWHRKLDVVKEEFEHEFSFSIVRHPITWYESAWKHTKAVKTAGIGWGNENHPLSDLEPLYDPDFSKFIDNVIEKVPGYYSKALEDYIGEDYNGVDFIAKTETLYFDAVKIMERLGIKYNMDTVLKSPKFQRLDNTINWKEGQKEKILELENRVIKHFYNEKT